MGSAVLGRAIRYSVVHRDIGSNRAARSARYLLSDFALVLSLTRLPLSRGLTTTKRGTFSSLAVLICRTSPSPRFFQNRQPTPSTSRIPTPSTFVFNCVCYLLPLALRSVFFLHSGPWIAPSFAPCQPSHSPRHPPRHLLRHQRVNPPPLPLRLPPRAPPRHPPLCPLPFVVLVGTKCHRPLPPRTVCALT